MFSYFLKASKNPNFYADKITIFLIFITMLFPSSWLLQYSGLIVRSSELQFVDRVKRYNSQLLPLLENLQFTKGGPIIAFQVCNVSCLIKC
jgi:hypothetical protein